MTLSVDNLNPTILAAPVDYENFMIKFMSECGHDDVWNSSLINRTAMADAVARGPAKVGSVTVRTAQYSAAEFGFMDEALNTCPTSGEFSEVSMLVRKTEAIRKYDAENAMQHFMSCDSEDPLLSYYNDVSGPYWRKFYGQLALVQLIATYKNLAADAVNGPQAIMSGVVGAVANSTETTSGISNLTSYLMNESDNLVACSIVNSVIMHQAVATHLENQGVLQCQCVQNDVGAVSNLYTLNDGRPVTVIRDAETKALLQGGASAALPAPLTNLGFDGPAGTYLTICYREGVIHYGEGCHPRPIEVDSTPCAGGGSGAEEIYERRRFVMTVEGFSFVGATGQGDLPTTDNRAPNFSDFGNDAHWALVFPIERLPVKYIVSDLA